MTSARQIKRRHDAQTAYRIKLWAFDPALDVDWRAATRDDWEDWPDEDEGLCLDCDQPHDMCECHIGAECGRWRNGVLSDSCSKAGSEECDFECPYSR